MKRWWVWSGALPIPADHMLIWGGRGLPPSSFGVNGTPCATVQEHTRIYFRGLCIPSLLSPKMKLWPAKNATCRFTCQMWDWPEWLQIWTRIFAARHSSPRGGKFEPCVLEKEEEPKTSHNCWRQPLETNKEDGKTRPIFFYPFFLVFLSTMPALQNKWQGFKKKFLNFFLQFLPVLQNLWVTCAWLTVGLSQRCMNPINEAKEYKIQRRVPKKKGYLP